MFLFRIVLRVLCRARILGQELGKGTLNTNLQDVDIMFVGCGMWTAVLHHPLSSLVLSDAVRGVLYAVVPQVFVRNGGCLVPIVAWLVWGMKGAQTQWGCLANLMSMRLISSAVAKVLKTTSPLNFPQLFCSTIITSECESD